MAFPPSALVLRACRNDSNAYILLYDTPGKAYYFSTPARVCELIFWLRPIYFPFFFSSTLFCHSSRFVTRLNRNYIPFASDCDAFPCMRFAAVIYCIYVAARCCCSTHVDDRFHRLHTRKAIKKKNKKIWIETRSRKKCCRKIDFLSFLWLTLLASRSNSDNLCNMYIFKLYFLSEQWT